MTDPLETLLPRHKTDLDNAHRVVERGYPAVAPLLPQLLEWVKDGNWPVAHILAPFLASIGSPIVPHVRDILRGDDDLWKYYVVARIVRMMPRATAEALRPELTRIASDPTSGEEVEAIDDLAAEILRQWEEPA
ncbi:DUF5071 domain-containing protein [Archangium minus]|uniref:DUF5071 domain-containing protein n=1 Tax=Archangium minus TaxID=83450 RepID=A0ABY9X8Z1_9BACT|nr:DUF5071 domain-containing protein [Archangium minus]